jgi:hypothetical protein
MREARYDWYLEMRRMHPKLAETSGNYRYEDTSITMLDERGKVRDNWQLKTKRSIPSLSHSS